jgi:transcriptional regulator with XRE-family HTH domain
MKYATEYIAGTLKAAREGKGLSQRALSKLAGVPQSHISRIENGVVDLRLSSLVEIARALDLELTLVPRKNVSAVRSIVRSSWPAEAAPHANSVAKELKRLRDSLAIIALEYPETKEIAQVQRQVRELQRLQLAIPHLDTLREASKTVEAFKESTKGLADIRKTLSNLQSLRNTVAHALPPVDIVKPVYSLDEGENG